MENNETNVPVVGSGAIAAADQEVEVKEFSIEELIRYHADTLDMMDGTGCLYQDGFGWNVQAIRQTINNLKIFKEL